MFLFKKDPALNRAGQEVKTQIYGDTEQKTPKAGYFLLLLMVIVALMFGWRALDDLADVPSRPELLSNCAYEFVMVDWEDAGRFDRYQYAEPMYFNNLPYAVKTEKPPCVFSDTETRYGIAKVYEKRQALGVQLQNFTLELQKVENSILDYERQYNLGLTEKIAIEQKQLYAISEIQSKLEPLRRQKAELEIEIDRLFAEKKPLDESLKAGYKTLLPELRTQWRWYEFWIFLLEALFIIPFFLLVFGQYKKFLLKKSPYTIIFTALLFVASVFMLRIFISWFWSLFLARILQTIWVFAQNFALLKSLVFYGGMFGSIAIFGGAVYFLQKHIFDPKRVAIRSLRKNTCPQCEVTLAVAGEFCPNCGRKIREKCDACGNMRYVDFLACPHCGSKKL